MFVLLCTIVVVIVVISLLFHCFLNLFIYSAIQAASV